MSTAAVVGTLAALNAVLQIQCDAPVQGQFAGAASASVSCNITGTFTGTIVFEASTDGQNWFATSAHQLLGAGLVLGPTQLSTTAIGTFVMPLYGWEFARVRVSAYTSGTVNVAMDVGGAAPVGIALVNTEGCKPTYSAAVNAHAPAATPTDWFTIQGSATKTIRLTRLTIVGRATAANQYRISLIKYSAFLTGGTPAAVTAIPHDSNDPAATAAVQTWASGLPTPGTAVGKIADDSIPQAAIGTPSGQGQIVYDFGIRPARAVVLRGTAQYLALNSAAVALPAGSVFDVKAEWTEE